MKTLGTTTTYGGTEHAYLRGHKVRIVAVLKNALRADYDPDRDGQYIRDEEDLERAGGVTADDRVEVQPWLAAEGRFSFVSSDPRAIDLACTRDDAREHVGRDDTRQRSTSRSQRDRYVEPADMWSCADPAT
jgi:hypothetical protein